MNDEEPPLSDDEIREVRAILKAEQHMIWLRSNVRVWGAWLSGGVIMGFAIYKAVSEFFAIKVGLK